MELTLAKLISEAKLKVNLLPTLLQHPSERRAQLHLLVWQVALGILLLLLVPLVLQQRLLAALPQSAHQSRLLRIQICVRILAPRPLAPSIHQHGNGAAVLQLAIVQELVRAVKLVIETMPGWMLWNHLRWDKRN